MEKENPQGDEQKCSTVRYQDISGTASGRRRIINGCWVGMGLSVFPFLAEHGPFLFLSSKHSTVTAPITAAIGILLCLGMLRKSLWAARLFMVYLVILIISLLGSKINGNLWFAIVPAILMSFPAFLGVTQYYSGSEKCPVSHLNLRKQSRKEHFKIKSRTILKQFRLRAPHIKFHQWIVTISGTLISGAALLVYFLGEFFPFEKWGISPGERGVWALGIGTVGFTLFRYSLSYWTPSAEQTLKLDHRPPILLLRPFQDDHKELKEGLNISVHQAFRVERSLEEALVKQLSWDGPVVAMGNPDDKLPPLGAGRDYSTNSTNTSWQEKIETLSKQAQLIVIQPGKTAGVLWELKQIIDLKLLNKTIILFPPSKEEELTERWKILAQMADESPEIHALKAASPTGVLAICFTPDGFPIVIKGQQRWGHYKETVKAAVGLIHLMDHRNLEHIAAAIDKIKHNAVLFHMARFFLSIHQFELCEYTLYRFFPRIYNFPILRVFRVHLPDLKKFVPGIRDIEPIPEEHCRPSDIQRLIENFGLFQLIELIHTNDLEKIPMENWFNYNIVRFGQEKGEPVKKKFLPLPITYDEHRCVFCNRSLEGSLKGLRGYSGYSICQFCIQLIDSLLYMGKKPEPSHSRGGRCDFCQTEKGEDALLCDNNQGLHICLRCAEFSIVSKESQYRFAATVYHRLPTLSQFLASDNPWQIHWALSRVIQFPILLKKINRGPEIIVNLLGHPSRDVRERAFDVCHLPEFIYTDLLRPLLKSPSWQVRINSVLSLSCQYGNQQNGAAFLPDLLSLYKEEKNEEVLDGLLYAFGNLLCQEALDALNQMGEQPNQKIEKTRQHICGNLKDYLEGEPEGAS